MSLFRPLRDVITFKGGGTPSKSVAEYWGGPIPWATVKDFTSTKISSTQDHITEAGLRNSSANLIPRGHVIIPTRMSLGKAAINDIELAINQDLRALIPREPLDASYLLHAILSLRDTIVLRGSGATVKGINQSELYALEIFFPSLDDQIRIAHLLDKVEGLITQRKQQLRQLEDLVKSVFGEMFGDPVRNNMGWGRKAFSSLLFDINSGKSPKCESRPASAEEWGVLKLGAITKCTYFDTENKALPENVSPSVRDEVKPGDLLFSRKNTRDLIAACAYVFTTRPKLLLPDLIFRFVFKDDAAVDPIYIWKLLTSESQRKVVQALAAGAAGSMPNISKANLKNILLPIPPLELQGVFGSFVRNVEHLKSKYQRSLIDLEALYGALSQQAFRGQLDLSRVPLPDTEPQKPHGATSATSSLPSDQGAIDLPDTELLPAALYDQAPLQELLLFWLETYLTQLNGAAFSVKDFLGAVQTRIGELYPDDDFELGADAYEQVKGWVFAALASGRLTQGYAHADNRVTLTSKSPDWGAW
jgi:type I restriction enzyme, S subunit